MNNIQNITFIYDTVADTCQIQELAQPKRELTIKGPTDYQGTVNGTWFQIDSLTSHWMSFKWLGFSLSNWQVFYKRVQGKQITYYRKVFYGVENILTFSFSEKDEWIKINGKWQSKYLNKLS